jgi:hypothetical protein
VEEESCVLAKSSSSHLGFMRFGFVVRESPVQNTGTRHDCGSLQEALLLVP